MRESCISPVDRFVAVLCIQVIGGLVNPVHIRLSAAKYTRAFAILSSLGMSKADDDAKPPTRADAGNTLCCVTRLHCLPDLNAAPFLCLLSVNKLQAAQVARYLASNRRLPWRLPLRLRSCPRLCGEPTPFKTRHPFHWITRVT